MFIINYFQNYLHQLLILTYSALNHQGFQLSLLSKCCTAKILLLCGITYPLSSLAESATQFLIFNAVMI